ADRDAVIVSLNFESDHKQQWPDYIKARKVYEEWQSALALEPRADTNYSRQRTIKRDIARRFALTVNEVTRFIKMTELASEFEEYHVGPAKHDTYEVKHRAREHFQYFDELGKGQDAGGVRWSLNQDETFKHLVYDLLYEGKFPSWREIRELKHIYKNED